MQNDGEYERGWKAACEYLAKGLAESADHMRKSDAGELMRLAFTASSKICAQTAEFPLGKYVRTMAGAGK